jgi:hypothetical protein
MIRNSISSAFIVVSADPIAERAYDIYVERGRADGFDLEDWLQAERELNGMTTIPRKRVSTRVKNR